MELITNQSVIEFLVAEQGDSDLSISSYWKEELKNFSVNPMGETSGRISAGNVSMKTGAANRFAHWLLQTPWRRMGRRFSTFKTSYEIGKLVASNQRRQFTNDMIRQSLTLALVRDLIDVNLTNGEVCVIGDGYGVLGSLLSHAFPQKKIIFVNLKTPLTLDVMYYLRGVPGASLGLAEDEDSLSKALLDPNISAIAIRADNSDLLSLIPISLAFNVVSMQEMPPTAVDQYFDYLRSNPAPITNFYCCNRIHKELYAGEVLRFFDYPWASDDKIFIDEICEWDRLTYGPSPPFWHLKPESTLCQHRLVQLAKKN